MRIFLFDHLASAYLGDMSFSDGKMSSFVLSAEGEKRLGREVEKWQTQGIPAMRDIVAGNRRILVRKQVQPRSPQFMASFTDWALGEQLVPLHVPNHVISGWEKLTALPFTPRERLLFLRALCRAPASAAKTWDDIFDEALKATQKV